MIDRVLILIFFCIFLFLPLIRNFDSQPVSTKKTTFSNRTSKLQKYRGFNTSNNQIVDAIAKVSQSVVGISVVHMLSFSWNGIPVSG